MKKNRKYLKPYIRRAKPKDFKCRKASDISVAIDMVDYKNLPKSYVFVQHGSRKIVGIGISKMELKRKVWAIRSKKRGINKRYNEWANRVKHYSQGE